MSIELTPEQARLLAELANGGEARIPDLAARLSLDQAQVAAAATLLAQAGLVTLREEPYSEWSITDVGRGFVEAGPPEWRVLHLLAERGSATLGDLPALTGLDVKDVGQSIRPVTALGWVEKSGTDLQVTPAGRAAISAVYPPLAALERLADGERLTGTALQAEGIDPGAIIAIYGPKSRYFDIREKVHRYAALTEAGRSLAQSGVQARREVTQLTPELLASGEWREVRFKPYDISLATEPRHPGKRHPLQLVIDRVRRAFLEMGFEEASSSWVESSFWDFDALFQPQDHPAREMQDTFYVSRPERTPLPADAELVARVRAAHEDGGGTGSAGWQYRWDPRKAEKNILRTHTTATTIRALAAEPTGARKVFCLGKVFRREAIDYKHLPIFIQVDGIILDERASFSSLLGTLGAFYERMGFSKYYFRPGFFPYTEPSVEVYIWHEEKQDWFEMGGAGIFRPEVTEPLGCTSPVLAWGLGIDRLAMLLYDLKDIRDLYLADTEWLKGVPRCR
ncbi:MAG: phenylalanine--tRNA ligase subunit alpha [Candidatus Eisenbacteria bacterium]|nr:phenylalanine--tRNA ligase subunit alpha [Candidatus Eisenbacteria bacterium]